DGIRDATVTGVQTCALPISTPRKGQDDAERNEGGERWQSLSEVSITTTASGGAADFSCGAQGRATLASPAKWKPHIAQRWPKVRWAWSNASLYLSSEISARSDLSRGRVRISRNRRPRPGWAGIGTTCARPYVTDRWRSGDRKSTRLNS